MGLQTVEVIARTFETKNDTTEQMNNDLTLLAGKAAGVCYMPDNYLDEGIQNETKALNRAEGNSKSGHHSVYDHGNITFILNTNKMIAMILNSLSVYATSEKSSRYTKMHPETELELNLYDKWKTKLQKAILETYPDTDDDELSKRVCKKAGIDFEKIVANGKLIDAYKNDENIKALLDIENKSETIPSAKLGMENARYMISVFTPTTMAYTTSFRQAQLIVDYFTKLEKDLKEVDDTFSHKLLEHVVDFRDAFSEAIGTKRLADNKNQGIRFLYAQTVKDNIGELEEIADSYTLNYVGSLAMLAQAQRHRTLRYKMILKTPGEYGWYVPEIVKEHNLQDEWLTDMESVSYCVPQGTLVKIIEQGLFEDFVLKCKERLCGRAQLETMRMTKDNMKKFIERSGALSQANKKLLNSVTELDNETGERQVVARCKFEDFTCTEGCRWGCNESLERLI